MSLSRVYLRNELDFFGFYFPFINFENPLPFFKVNIAEEGAILEKDKVVYGMLLKYNFTC